MQQPGGYSKENTTQEAVFYLAPKRLKGILAWICRSSGRERSVDTEI